MSNEAIVFKEKGNACFKDRRFNESSEFFRKAESSSPSDPIYPSNLSAALYELGDYCETVRAISRSWNLIAPGSNPTLSLKLSNRLVKALCHGIHAGTITPDIIQENEATINALECVAINASSPGPWKEWRKIQAEGDRSQHAREARARFSQIPIFKKATNDALTYYTLGQDNIMSMIDDWGPEDKFPMRLSELSEPELGDISFLFGGVGDARHVYGTLIGLHRAFKTLPSDRSSKFKVHITLLDIHPAALTLTGPSDIAATEIKATIFYVYVGVVLPAYCHQRLHNAIENLKSRLSSSPPDLPSWLCVSHDVIPSLQGVLQYWSGPVFRERTTSGMLGAHSLPNHSLEDVFNSPDIAPEYRAQFTEALDEKRKYIGKMMDSLDSNTLEQLGVIKPDESPEEAKKAYAKRKKSAIDLMLKMEVEGTMEGQMDGEKTFYELFKVFIPPPELYHRHPGFEGSMKNKSRMVPVKVQKLIKAHIKETWKLNPTLIDQTTKHASLSSGDDYPELNLDTFETPKHIYQFVHRFGLGAPRVAGNDLPSPAYTHITAFFGGVVEALKVVKDQITLEFLHGDLMQELSKMRMYLSNVPDYTHGIINTIVYTLPNLKTGKDSAVAASSVLNSGIWASDDEFCHTYTLLHPRDVPRYLGCQLIRNEAINDLVILGNNTLPRPISSLASRQELDTWLTRILLNTLIPANSGFGQFRAILPNNLAAFFGLLIYLHTVGYPGHWLADFLSNVINDNMVTDIAPFQGKWPIPLSDMNRRVPRRKVRLDPWKMELENILVSSSAGIPFFISLPEDFSTDHTDITIFEGTFQHSSSSMNALISPFEPVVSLLFYKIVGGSSADALVRMLPSVLEGGGPAPGRIYVLTCQELVDCSGSIRWRMSKAMAQRMRQERWAMVGYRTDTQEPFTRPLLSSEWVDIPDESG